MERMVKATLLVFLLTLLGLAASQVHSFDIFWQLHSGRYIWQTKSFIYHDLFSLAADVPRHEHCWLHDLIFYGCYGLFGYAGISLLKGVLIALTGVFLALAARVRGASTLAVLFILPPAMLLTRGGWLERPQLWTFLFFALFVLLLEKYRQQAGRWIFLLLPVMVVWNNLHAGAVLAFAILLAYLGGEGGEMLLRRSRLDRRAWLRLLLLMVLLFVASLATPYGSKVLQTLMGAPNLGAQGGEGPMTALYNMDWRNTTFATDPAFFYALGLAGILLAAGWRRLVLTDLFLLGGLALMGWKLSRHTHFFLFGCAAILPLYADAALAPLLRRLQGKARPIACALALAAAIASAGYFAAEPLKKTGFFNLGLRDWHYPIQAAEFVEENRLPKNLYNTYEWGGYLMWTLFPEYQVFWDARQDSPEMYRLGWQVMAGKPGWEEILARFEVNTVVSKGCTVDTGQHYPLLDRLRESPEWTLVFTDGAAMVFVRNAAVEESWLAEYRLPESRVDDTILFEAQKLVDNNPGRYKAYWEIARISLERKDYRRAFDALGNYLSRSPQQDPVAENYYRILYPMFNPEK
jgi:hypothetical protein